MDKKQILLKEKQRYNLPLEISDEEIELLKKETPVQKIIGYIEMQDVTIFLDKKVLIPRYETEELILKALEYIQAKDRVLDLCCGSGFIGLAIAKKTKSNVVLADIDENAIEQSKYNAKYNNLEVDIIQSNLFDNIQGKFDYIISNPPYIPQEIQLDDSVILHEPLHALYAKDEGNYFYKKIIAQAPKYLNKGGKLILEISPWNLKYFHSLKMKVEIFKDINQKERIAIIAFN